MVVVMRTAALMLCSLLAACSAPPGDVIISCNFTQESADVIVDAADRWSEAIGEDIPAVTDCQLSNVRTYDEAPDRIVERADWRSGVTANGRIVYLRDDPVRLTTAMHELGHLLGVPHIDGDPLMSAGAGLTPEITENAAAMVH